MLKIYPNLEFKASCPQDGVTLQWLGVAIPGMRCLADGICPTCNARYYADLPVSHALELPMILNRETGEIYDPKDVEWFRRPLKEGFRAPIEEEIVPQVHRFLECDRIIIVNCLDYLYGHCLLKLLNVQRHLDEHPELGCCVLVPSQLLHLVPDGVAEIWEFPRSISEGGKWYSSLQRWINEKISNYQECYLSPAYSHPSHRVYDLRRFVRNLPDLSDKIRDRAPIILFSYREDRPWGRTLQQQQQKLQNLYERLSRIFPEMLFVLVGFGRENRIQNTGAEVLDLRAEKFEVERDRLWMAYMSVADCAIGVHGSNMLLPSGLAKSTITLVPRSRLGNIFQDTLFPHNLHDARDILLQYRSIYGSEDLSDLRSSTVAEIAIALLAFQQQQSFWFKVGEEEISSPEVSRVQQFATQYFLPFPFRPLRIYGKLTLRVKNFLNDYLERLDER
ncbi:hypothetical protein [Oscillatoria sp. FACHB-1406]|uniref:hypothetical protein n=1 Tax=Oscillatoria sp. FACHB-1406 TaxID=2692846 RepID=UPI0016868116|nr:hypothetical protein [Oscillatoria sp. FACHB-1406]MBD2579001.1 hypothetical protein [Oscillatoria sp. FACHB-1406]